MKLETAYRKLRKHQSRWQWEIKPHSWRRGGTVIVSAAYLSYTGNFPVELLGKLLGDERRHIVHARGLTNAMTAMADKLDRVELAITKHNEAVEAAKEAQK